MCLRRPIHHALGHRVGLVPDDVRAEPPAVRLEGEGDAPGYSNQVFRLESGDRHTVRLRHRPDRGTCVRLLGAPTPTAAMSVPRIALSATAGAHADAARSGRVTIPQIQPQRPVIAQHPPHLAEDHDKMRDVQLWRGLEAELDINAASPAPPTIALELVR